MAEHFPAPWDVDRLTATVYATDVPKGPARVADMRGWGYLTGKGHGALSLSEDEAIDIQRANAEHIIKCVNSHPDLVKALETAAARFNMIAGIGLVNGVDPKVGYREIMDVLSRVKGAPDHG